MRVVPFMQADATDACTEFSVKPCVGVGVGVVAVVVGARAGADSRQRHCAGSRQITGG